MQLALGITTPHSAFLPALR